MSAPLQAHLDAEFAIRQAAAQQRRINADLDMLIESDRAMTRKAMIDWLVDNYAMSEAQAARAYMTWREDVA